MRDAPLPHKILRWFRPRARQIGSWGFTLNRLTALGLTFYLGLHLIILSKLTQGQNAYDDFVMFARHPLIKISEIILIAAVLFHGLNGIRLTLHALGMDIRIQTISLRIVLALTILGSILFAIRLFGV